MSANNELDLYKLLLNDDSVKDLGWRNDMFLVWIYSTEINKFISKLKQIFGDSLFDDSRLEIQAGEYDYCIDLTQIDSKYSVGLEEIFSKKEFN